MRLVSVVTRTFKLTPKRPVTDDYFMMIVTTNMMKVSAVDTLQRASATKAVTVELLDRKHITIETEPKAKLRTVFDQVCKRIGLKDTQIFGLAVRTDEDAYEFLDLDTKICKRAPKQWRMSHKGVGKDGKVLYSLSLRVHYYVDSQPAFRDAQAMHQYYLQMRENFLNYGFEYPDDRCFLVSSYAIQADCRKAKTNFDPREYFPAWVVEKHSNEFITRHMPSLQQDLQDICRLEAERLYIQELSTHSPAAYNMHLYKMRDAKNEPYEKTMLGIGVKGLDVYKVNSRGFLDHLTSCLWSAIEKINFMKKKLEIIVGGKTLVFYTSSEDWCKYVFSICKDSHMVQLGFQKEAGINQSLADKLKFRESYVYSSDKDLEWEREQSLIGSTLSLHGRVVAMTQDVKQNRFSIISTTSSNTTSGIVSDRTCLSFDSSQEELLRGLRSVNTTSRDSLLDPICDISKSRPVQRATSEPSRKFEQLRELTVKQHPHKQLPRRTLSDKTVVGDDHEHVYENAAAIRYALMAKLEGEAAVNQLSRKGDRESPRASQGTVTINYTPRQGPDHLNNTIYGGVYETPNYGLSSGYPAALSSLYHSLSTEKLLTNYTPPPSYSEHQKKQRQQEIQRQMSELQERQLLPTELRLYSSNSPLNVTPLNLTHKKAWSAEEPPLSAQKQPMQVKCECRNYLSHPEIDKLRESKDVSLPMITALCNDKELRLATGCRCKSPPSLRPVSWCPPDAHPVSSCQNEPRPLSWHSESFVFASMNPNSSCSVPPQSAINVY